MDEKISQLKIDLDDLKEELQSLQKEENVVRSNMRNAGKNMLDTVKSVWGIMTIYPLVKAAQNVRNSGLDVDKVMAQIQELKESIEEKETELKTMKEKYQEERYRKWEEEKKWEEERQKKLEEEKQKKLELEEKKKLQRIKKLESELRKKQDELLTLKSNS